MKRMVIATSILVACLMAGCGGDMKTYSDPEETISVGVNREFSIGLEAFLRVGHKWHESYDGNMLTLVDRTYVDDFPSDPACVSGTSYFKFKALKKGQPQITFEWGFKMRDGKPPKQRVFQVEIK
ncbi:MAG: protease inhibitor I42 family protein [Chloroflexota bacterium]|nr:protease inhibitor I42 family protein [Chloroflexota bacterium]